MNWDEKVRKQKAEIYKKKKTGGASPPVKQLSPRRNTQYQKQWSEERPNYSPVQRNSARIQTKFRDHKEEKLGYIKDPYHRTIDLNDTTFNNTKCPLTGIDK